VLNLGHKEFKEKWLKKREKLVNKISIKDTPNPNFERKKVKANRDKTYSYKNVIGVPQEEERIFPE
jgi:hypothetical protein